MIIRDFKKDDTQQVEAIFALHFTDAEFLKELSDALEQYPFFVAEEDGGEIVGVGGLRSAPEYLARCASTTNPAEFYIVASKYKGRGIGESLRVHRLEAAKKLGYTEVVLYSPNSHQVSWGFHDRLGFERVGEVVAPDGYPGQVWRRAV